MKKVTQRDVAESISGLRGVAADLQQAVNSNPVVQGLPPGTVLVQANVLARHARYIEGVADELLGLIPEKPVSVPP